MISRLIKDLFRVYPYFDRNREHRRWLLSSYETLRGDFIRRFLPFSLSFPFFLSLFVSSHRDSFSRVDKAGSGTILRLVRYTINGETKMESPVGLQDAITRSYAA